MTKLKPISSPEIMGIVPSLCDQTVNTYDWKNHARTIRDKKNIKLNSVRKLILQVVLFEKQLKMFGFKGRKYSQGMITADSDKDIKIVVEA